MNNLILGGGLSGLILGYLHKDYAVISDNFGDVHAGPFLLHHSKCVESFLDKVGMPYKIRKAFVGYSTNGVYVGSKPIGKFKNEYAIKSGREEHILHDKTIMNSGISKFNVCEINTNSLAMGLISKSKCMQCTIENIDLDEKYVDIGVCKIPYNKVISTIPLKTFCSLSNSKTNQLLYSGCIGTYYGDNVYENSDGYDFVYDASVINDFYRATPVGQGRMLYETLDFDKATAVKYTQIRSIDNPYSVFAKRESVKDILFAGRFGRWDKKILINDVIEFALNLR